MFVYVLVVAGIIMTAQGPQGGQEAIDSFATLKACEAKKTELIKGGLTPITAAAGLTCAKVTLVKNPNFKAPEPKFN
jgi:hypothetical protein